MNPRLKIPKSLIDAMIAQAKSETPHECCGLLAGRIVDTEAVAMARMPLVNASATPWNRFESSAESMFAVIKQLRVLGLDVLAVYHSHPLGGSTPSAIDRELNYAPDVANVIIDLSQEPAVVKAWRVEGSNTDCWPIEVVV